MLRDVSDHVPRPRLLSGHVLAPVLLVAGPSGSGTSVLLRELSTRRGVPLALVDVDAADRATETLVHRLRTALRAAGLSDAATSLAAREVRAEAALDAFTSYLATRDDPLIVGIDGADRLDAAGADLLVRLASNFPDGHHLVVLARSVDGPLQRLKLLTPTLVGADDLAFTDDEAQALLEEQLGLEMTTRQIRALNDAARGNVLALSLAGRRLAATGDRDEFDDVLARFTSGRGIVTDTVGELLDGMRRRDRRAMVTLAGLAWFDRDLAVELLRDTAPLDAAVAAGFVAASSDGRLGFHAPVRDAIGAYGAPGLRTLRRAADALAARGALLDGVRLLLDAALEEQAADTLATADTSTVLAMPVSELAAIVDTLDDGIVDARPRILLLLARAWHVAGHAARKHRVLDRAEALTGDVDDRTRRALQAERLRDAVHLDPGRCDVPRRRSHELLDQIHPTEHDVRGRLLEGLGLIEARRGDEGWDERARSCLEGAIEAYDAAGEPWLAAVAATMLAARVSLPTSHPAEAINELDGAVAAARGEPTLTALALTHRARAHAQRGRRARASADIDEATRLARLLADEDTLGFTSQANRDLVEAGIAPARVEVRVLDELAVRMDGDAATLRGGQPTQMLKVLAVRGGRVHQDEVVRALWPDEEAEDVRSRVENVRYRLNNGMGVVERDGEFLSLADDVELDMARFVELAREATAADEHGIDTVCARAAVEAYGELLPDDDEDWISVARERMRTRVLELLDALLDAALAHGEIDDALRFAESAWRADPHDPQRHGRLVELLLEHGRGARASTLRA